MAIGLVLSLSILVFRKQVFELGLTDIGLNVTVLELGIALIAIACYGKSLHQSWGDNIMTAPVRWFGRNSYEIYLTHCILIIPCVFIIQYLGLSKNLSPVWFLTLIMFSGLSGAIVARYFSEPMNRLLRNKMEIKQQRFEYIG
jgi:peptidoglycan/LPS O-acetylase OafA/YrhL